ncbi:MAG: ferrochelatase [Pseudomonadales bacterium]
MLKQRAVVLVNLGTPEVPTASAVRKFLKRFLSDPRVVEIPRPIWWMILHCFVLPLRCKRVAESYASIWMEGGSPLKVITERITSKLQQRFSDAVLHDTRAGETRVADIKVAYAMTYGEPSLTAVLDQFAKDGVEDFFILPLYPQYSATTTAAIYDQLAEYITQRRNLPSLYCHKDYHDNPRYISALAESIERHRQHNDASDCLLFSFHGIPKVNVMKGDPYEQQCNKTARLVAQHLGLNDNEWKISFQSRFGRAEWLQPYTVDVLQRLGEDKTSVNVISPAFAADCLETLEEMNIENRHIYMEAGGKNFNYIPCLNDDAAHIETLFRIVTFNHESNT